MGADGDGGALGGGCVIGERGGGIGACAAKRRRVGIETEADLAAPLVDERS
jgi:hypothetical protein